MRQFISYRKALKTLPCLFLLSALSACVTSYTMMDEALPKLVGQNSSEAVKYLGFPSSEQMVMGKKVYVWSTQMWIDNYTSATTTTSGKVDGKPFTTTTTTHVANGGHNERCELRLIVRADEVIERFQYDGDSSACLKFGLELRPLRTR